MANAVKKIRAAFEKEAKSLTLSEIRLLCPDLVASEISSSLCHLMKLKNVTREQVEGTGHRTFIWKYTYLPKP